MKVLMIDDDEDTNFLISLLLRKTEVVDEFWVHSSPIHALQLLQTGEATPDCIFVDLSMPEMNGYTFVENYEKTCLDKHPHTIVFMLSSSARESDRERIHDFASVKGFILKPLTKSRLREIAADCSN